MSSASASNSVFLFSAAASISFLYLSASACFAISALSLFSRTLIISSVSSCSLRVFAIFASTVRSLITFCCSCSWIAYAASDIAFLTSDSFFKSARLISSSLFRSAIAVSEITRASLASLLASACAIAISFSDCAFVTAASFLIFHVLSAPRSLIRFCSSVTF